MEEGVGGRRRAKGKGEGGGGRSRGKEEGKGEGGRRRGKEEGKGGGGRSKITKITKNRGKAVPSQTILYMVLYIVLTETLSLVSYK